MMLLLSGLLACVDPLAGPGPDRTTSTPTEADTATGSVDLPIPPPPLDAGGVAAAIDQTTAAGVPEPLLARAAYLSIFAHRDPRCPGGQGTNLPGRFQGCLAESGWLFAGLAEYTGPPDPSIIDDFHLLGDFNVQDADGNWFIGGGELDLDVHRGPGTVSWTGEVSGTWSWPAWTGWMTPEGAGGVMHLEVQRTDMDWSATVDGPLTNGVDSVHLFEVRATSNECGGAATGPIELRDASGHWYRLDATCGCGPVSWADGTPLGEACVALDLSPLASMVPP